MENRATMISVAYGLVLVLTLSFSCTTLPDDILDDVAALQQQLESTLACLNEGGGIECLPDVVLNWFISQRWLDDGDLDNLTPTMVLRVISIAREFLALLSSGGFGAYVYENVDGEISITSLGRGDAVRRVELEMLKRATVRLQDTRNNREMTQADIDEAFIVYQVINRAYSGKYRTSN